MKEGYPDDNPKTAIGAKKVPLHLVPPAAMHYTALAFADGARKYGPYNWREKRVSSSVYVGAALRHLQAFWDGEDVSADAQVHHLGHVMACCAIILDGMSINMLNDDRPVKGAAGRLQAEYADVDKKENPEVEPERNQTGAACNCKWCQYSRLDIGALGWNDTVVLSRLPNVQADLCEKAPCR